MSERYQLSIKSITSFGLIAVGLTSFFIVSPVYLPEYFDFLPNLFLPATTPFKIYGPVIFILSIICIFYGVWLASYGRIKVKIEDGILYHRDALFRRPILIKDIMKWEYLEVDNSYKKQLILFLPQGKTSIDITYCNFNHGELVEALSKR